jgi:integrase
LLTAWGKLELPKRATLFSLSVALAMSGVARLIGTEADGVCVLLMFHCLLRTIEPFNILVGDCSFGADLESCVITLRETKTSQKAGGSESVVADNAKLVRRLWQLCQGRHVGDKLFAFDVHHFRRMFNQCLVVLELKGMNYTPYSLRRGGATWHFRIFGRMDATMVRGRWSAARSARIYINDGVAELARHSLDVRQTKLVSLAARKANP